MDLADLVESFSTRPLSTYAVTRRLASTFTLGRAVPDPSPTTIQIVASVQPATGRELLRLPEGRRDQETRVVFTVTELFCGGQAATYEADKITIDGVVWEVQHVERWVQPLDGDLVFECVCQVTK